jgi:hypothetical protein
MTATASEVPEKELKGSHHLRPVQAIEALED